MPSKGLVRTEKQKDSPDSLLEKGANHDRSEHQVVIIGAGPAGLTAALELTEAGIEPLILEQLNMVGGISRTESYKGFYFDMGGHRFYSKSKYVENFWNRILGDDFLRRPRLSRIFYKQKYFNYPLKPFNVLFGLGMVQSLLIIASYVRWQIWPYPQEESFEEWVTNRFGKRLFETFFKSYTEKVWGIPCSELKADWAAQRIKDLSLKAAVLNMFFKPGRTIKTLIEEFHYPRLGPGMLWQKVKETVEDMGGTVALNSPAVRINRQGMHISSIDVQQAGRQETVLGRNFISSMPVSVLLESLNPPPPKAVMKAASSLKYRDFVTVCLIVNRPNLFPDNWIYIHDPSVQVGRIQNFKNWSPEMVPDTSMTSLGLEYFCNEGDALWEMSDTGLIELGICEVATIGLARAEEIVDGVVYRLKKTYPIYDNDYAHNLKIIRDYLGRFDNLQTIGRNGLHRYNNQDHAMLTGVLAVRNMLYGEDHNLWILNGEEAYQEEIQIDEVLGDEVFEIVDEVVPQKRRFALRAYDRVLGFGVGMLLGLGATAVLSWLLKFREDK